MSQFGDIITLEDFKTLARPTSIHLDAAHFASYVQEAESKYIIPAIGYELYTQLLDTELDEELLVIKEGGNYDKQGCPCTPGSAIAFCHGVKKTTAYYTYAIMQQADGGVMARAGFMRHENEYADHVDDRVKQYNAVMDMAELYLSSVLEAIKANDCCSKKARQTRATIKAIGD